MTLGRRLYVGILALATFGAVVGKDWTALLWIINTALWFYTATRWEDAYRTCERRED